MEDRVALLEARVKNLNTLILFQGLVLSYIVFGPKILLCLLFALTFILPLCLRTAEYNVYA
jgi:hypothetical protein